MTVLLKDSTLKNKKNIRSLLTTKTDDEKVAKFYRNKKVPFGFSENTFNVSENFHANFEVISLNDLQTDVLREFFETEKRSFLLNVPTGWGKTVFTLYIVSKLRLKTLVIIPRTVLKTNVWLKNIKQFSLDVDITVKGGIAMLNDVNGLKEVYDVIIIDECHMNQKLIFENLLFELEPPKVLIGLTATVKNHHIMKWFFQKIIVRETTKPFTVVKQSLNFLPDEKKRYIKGKLKLDYNYMMKSLVNNDQRNSEIIKRILEVAETRVGDAIVLVKYLKLRDFIILNLREHNITADIYNTKTQNSSRFIVETYNKLGVGYDDSSRTILFLCDNIMDVRQPEGRLRLNNVLIVDFVDNHSVFEKHWNKRLEWYKTRGAVVMENLT